MENERSAASDEPAGTDRRAFEQNQELCEQEDDDDGEKDLSETGQNSDWDSEVVSHAVDEINKELESKQKQK